MVTLFKVVKGKLFSQSLMATVAFVSLLAISHIVNAQEEMPKDIYGTYITEDGLPYLPWVFGHWYYDGRNKKVHWLDGSRSLLISGPNSQSGCEDDDNNPVYVVGLDDATATREIFKER